MLYHHRYAESKLERLAKLFPIVAVLGARQVGKSTLLAHFGRDQVKTFVFDPNDDLYGARRDPDFFLDQHQTPLLLDEVQYAPELLPALKRRADREPDARGLYFLTGSQNLALLRDVTESMAGRVGIIELSAMTVAEWSPAATKAPLGNWLERWLQGLEVFVRIPPERIPDTLSTTRRIWTGLMPKTMQAASAADVADILRSYVLTYLERDVRRMGDIANLDGFRRFLGLLAAVSAQEINVSHLGRELGVTRMTVQRWLGVLQATYQWIQIPPYHGNTIKRLAGHPKGYFHDSGLACHLQRISSSDALQVSPLLGSLYETLAATHLIKLGSCLPVSPAVYHWRSHGGAEVDLVLELDGRLWPFEFKAGTRITGHDTRGIAAFRAAYPDRAATPAAIIAPVEKAFALAQDIWVLPYDLA
jgi:hypothetical protein